MVNLGFKSAFSLMAVATMVAAGLVAVALVVTNPNQIGPVGVTIWFVALLVGVAGALSIGLYGFKSWLRPTDSKMNRLAASWRQGLLLGGSLTVILALQSLRQLGSRDVILVVMLGVLVEFYFRTKR